MSNIRNIGIFASVDAGKTTLTEQILYKSGTIRKLGNVDVGTAQTDNMTVERSRGISVRAFLTQLSWQDANIHIIDTPGHVDFSSQVEKSLWALDGAILLLSACDEISAYAKRIYQTLVDLKKPTIVFINKSDRKLADIDRTISEITKVLTPDIIPITNTIFDDKCNVSDTIFEKLSDYDDDLLTRYLEEDKLSTPEALKHIIKMTHDVNIHPVICGSALTGSNVETLLDSITKILPPPQNNNTEEPSGIIFGITNDNTMGRGAHVRLFGGNISVRDSIEVTGNQYKVTGIRKLKGLKSIDSKSIETGEIATIYGLTHSKVSDVIGNGDFLTKTIERSALQIPLLQADIEVIDRSQLQKLKGALDQLSAEDPAIDANWSNINQRFSIKIMGLIQLEILENILLERFDIKVKINQPEVIYKETPSIEGYGYDRYTMPKPCWAVLRFKITPMPRGSGVSYSCEVTNEQISHRYLKQVETTIPRALKQGMHGWEVTDLHIALIDGEDHIEHTHPLDFVVATPLALMDGLRNTGTDLLEPMLDVEFTLPIEFGGKVMSDISIMRGEFQSELLIDSINIKATIPAATSWDYAIKLASLTGGKGIMTSRFNGYKKCPLELGKTTPRRSVNPLDRSKYILAARNALDGKIFG